MKVVGFTFSTNPNPNLHVNNIVKRLRARTWALNKLIRCGFASDKLVKFYKGAIRSVAEYATLSFHPMIPQYLSDSLERQQSQALKSIYGWGNSARSMRDKSSCQTLWERREAASLKFAQKSSKNPRFSSWFPRRRGREGGRNKNPFYE